MDAKLKQEIFNHMADNHDVLLMEDDFNSLQDILEKHSGQSEESDLSDDAVSEAYYKASGLAEQERDLIDRFMKAVIKLHPNLAMDSPMEYEVYMSYHNLKNHLTKQEDPK